MALPPDAVYRKTASGQAALATRSAGLSAKLRTALILVNGREPMRMLQTRLGPDARAQVDQLLGLGFVEPVPAPGRSRPPTATPPPPLPDPEVLAALAALKREAVRRLAPQFGPDVEIVCQPLLASTSADAYRAALGAVEAKLAIYLGRGKARQALDGLWP